jgi:CheY-like chemotaxis protein
MNLRATFMIYQSMINTKATQSNLDSYAAPKGKETILLVEDEDMVREMVRELLVTQGYKVLEASNGAEALALCSKCNEPIHLLLTDVVMPQMNGKELAKQILKSYPSMKVLFMSGYTGDLVAPCDASDENQSFISKPFTANALRDRLRKLLD